MGYVIILLFLLVGGLVAIIRGAMWVAEDTNPTLAIVLGLYIGGIWIWMLVSGARELKKARIMDEMIHNAKANPDNYSNDDSQGDT